MSQYNHTTQQAGEPQQAEKWLIAWLDDFCMMLVLIGFAFWSVSCQPIPA